MLLQLSDLRGKVLLYGFYFAVERLLNFRGLRRCIVRHHQSYQCHYPKDSNSRQ